MQPRGAPAGRGIAGRDLHLHHASPAAAKRAVVAHARRARVTAPVEPASNNGHDPDKNAKATSLLRAIAELNHKYGPGTVMRQSDKPSDIPKFTSGCLSLDGILGGGWPCGRVVEVYGPESCGKTTLALHAISEIQKAGGIAAFIDLEHALDPEYAKRLGVVYGDNFVTAQPSCGEEALDAVDKLASSGAVGLIVLDSVSALVPRMEMETDMGQTQVGGQARLMSSATRKLISTAAKTGCTIMFINQIRHKVGVIYGSNETTSGGVALKFYSSVRVELRKKEAIKSGDDAIGIKVKAKVVKNKVAPPMRETTFDIMFGFGIDAIGALVDAAEMLGVVTRKGAWYYMGERRLGQGREKVIDSIRSDAELQKELQDLTQAELAQPNAALALGEDAGFDDEGVEEGVAGAAEGTLGYDE